AVYRLLPAPAVEPGCVQWLYDAFVRSVGLANRAEGEAAATAASGGLAGAVRIRAGRNARVAILRQSGSLEIASDMGGGSGGGYRPCAPPGLPGLSCDGLIRTVNGAGPDGSGDFSILGGAGVEVRNYPDEHRIVVDFTRALSDGSCEA
ncbi:MAG: hypothetical protein LBD54_03185, partial [Puniceicoccales bacterium]|nr:hypothetical protein [Puniceicoccales bacterium]